MAGARERLLLITDEIRVVRLLGNPQRLELGLCQAVEPWHVIGSSSQLLPGQRCFGSVNAAQDRRLGVGLVHLKLLCGDLARGVRIRRQPVELKRQLRIVRIDAQLRLGSDDLHQLLSQHPHLHKRPWLDLVVVRRSFG